MRSYFLQIGNYIFESGPSNRSPLHIEFEINSYENTGATTLGYVKLYNPSIDLYTKIQSLIGKNFILQAGWEMSPLIRQLDYTSVGRFTLVVGTIENIIGNFAERNPYISIFYRPNASKQKTAALGNLKNLKNVKDAISILGGKTEKQASKYEVSIPAYTFISKFLVDAVKHFTDYTIKPSKTLLALFNPSTQTIIIAATTLAELLFKFREEFGVEAKIDSSKKNLELYYGGAEGLKGAFGAAVDALSRGSKIIYMASEDMLAQPEVVNYNRNIHILARLRADATIGDIVVLQGIMPNSSQIAAGFGGGAVPTNINTRDIFKLGAYQITSITHKGEYYNPAAEAWSTSIMGTPLIKGGFSLLK